MPKPVPDLPDPADVLTVDWSRQLGPRLTTSQGHIYLRLFHDDADAAAALAAVRRLHAEVPADRHRDWPKRARQALGMVRCECPARPLRPFERVRADVLSGGFALCCVLLGEVGGLIARVVTGDPTHLIVGPAIGLLLAALRWVGRRGLGTRVEIVRPGEKAAMIYLAAAVAALSLGMPAGAFAAIWFGWPKGAVPLLMFVPVIPTFAVASWAAAKRAKTYARFHAARDAEAVAEWDALHADPQREPAWQAELWGEDSPDEPL